MASGHETYLSYLIADPNWQKLAVAIALGAGLTVGGLALTARLRTADGIEANVLPGSRLSLFGFADMLIEGFVRYHDSILGADNRRHAPFCATVFFFILLSNLLGLVPGIPGITTTVWVNVGIALVVFCYFNWQGIKAHGLVGYLKHFCGPIWWLAALIFPVEIISTCLRILTLNLRLYWNITADHLVLGVFTDMLGYVIPVAFYVLGAFVCFMQAFIFATLTMVYILLASEHEEEEEHH